MKKAPESGVRIIHLRLMFNLLMYRCMETKNFEINGEFRAMDMAELAYILTNQESVSMMVKEQEVVYGNVCTLDEVIYKMTPARKKLALAAIEFYKRGQAALSKYPKVSCSYDVFKLMSPVMSDLKVEEAWVIYVNQAAKVIRKQRISIGGIASTQVDVRVIMKEALLCGATSFFLVHNHPSGNLTPSRDDDRLTGALVEAGRMMNIKVLDHLIIGNNEYFSYGDEGRL